MLSPFGSQHGVDVACRVVVVSCRVVSLSCRVISLSCRVVSCHSRVVLSCHHSPTCRRVQPLISMNCAITLVCQDKIEDLCRRVTKKREGWFLALLGITSRLARHCQALPGVLLHPCLPPARCSPHQFPPMCGQSQKHTADTPRPGSQASASNKLVGMSSSHASLLVRQPYTRADPELASSR